MGTMCLPPGMKSKITFMGGMSVLAKLAISFLPLNYTACTPMFTAWLFICLMSFPEGTMVGEAMMRNNSTTLTEWCDFNRKAKSEYAIAATLARNSNDLAPPLPAALTTLYPNYLEIVVWSKSKKAWHLRKRATGWRGASRNNHVTLGIVGRMYFVQPLEGNRYYLRVLLTHVVGATCFEDLRTTHQPHTPTIVVHPTFKAACLACGLLQGDAELDQCLSEATGVQLPRSLR